MFDFRYHALSLVAVFVALAVGILLGVAIGDAGLVSSAERNIRESLRGDVRKARADAADARADVAAHDRFERDAYPALVAGRLNGMRIGIVGLGGLPDVTVERVKTAVRDTGGRVASVSVIREPLDQAGIARRAGTTRYAALGTDSTLAGPLGERLGLQYVLGGKLLDRVRPALLSSFSGTFKGLDAVVLVRSGSHPSGEGGVAAGAFERGLVKGMAGANISVVGVESTSTDPSQISWYKDRDIASVDNVDQIAGRAALVFALAGEKGAFGVKGTADELLPSAVGSASPAP
jgi:hypothetical protein